MCCEMALGVTLSSAAARTKLPSRALASKALSAFRGGSLRDMRGSGGDGLAFLLVGGGLRNIRVKYCSHRRLVKSARPGIWVRSCARLTQPVLPGSSLLGDVTDAFHPGAVRASMGAIFRLPLVRTTATNF